MNTNELIHEGRVNTTNWIIHLTQFGELNSVTCDDCIAQDQITINHAEGEEGGAE